jgi:hypothetical protein
LPARWRTPDGCAKADIVSLSTGDLRLACVSILTEHAVDPTPLSISAAADGVKNDFGQHLKNY